MLKVYYTALDPLTNRILAYTSKKRLKRNKPYATNQGRVTAHNIDDARAIAFTKMEATTWLRKLLKSL